jgi:hypothetical protein
MSQSMALEIAMKLEASPIKDNSRMMQIQSELAALTIQLVKITKEKRNMNMYGAPNEILEVTIKMNVQHFFST